MSEPPAASPRLTDVYAALPRAGTCALPGPPPENGSGCFLRNRVEWRGAHPAGPGGPLVWHLRAPDAESVRVALRYAGIPFDAVWASPALAPGPADP